MSNNNAALKYILLGCLGLTLLGACSIASCVALVYSKVDAPASAAKDFLSDLRQGQHGRALQRMSNEHQLRHDLASFKVAVAALPALEASSDDTLSGRQISDDDARMSGVLTTAEGPVPVEVGLVKLNGHWYVRYLSVDGQSLP